MKATISIDRYAPWSKDPSVSTNGHDPHISSFRVLDKNYITSETGIADFLAVHAPEIDPNGARLQVTDINDPTEDRDYYYLPSARDRRGYRTEVYVQIRERSA